MEIMEQILDGSISIVCCIQSLRLIKENIAEMEIEASKVSQITYYGMANIIELIADKMEKEIKAIIKECECIE